MQAIKPAKYEFRSFVNKLVKANKPSADEAGEELQIMDEVFSEVRVEHCKKDKDGKPEVEPIIDPKTGQKLGTQYMGLTKGECPEFDVALKEHADRRKGFLKETVTLDIPADLTIDKKFLPKDDNKDYDGSLQYFIEDFIK